MKCNRPACFCSYIPPFSSKLTESTICKIAWSPSLVLAQALSQFDFAFWHSTKTTLVPVFTNLSLDKARTAVVCCLHHLRHRCSMQSSVPFLKKSPTSLPHSSFLAVQPPIASAENFPPSSHLLWALNILSLISFAFGVYFAAPFPWLVSSTDCPI